MLVHFFLLLPSIRPAVTVRVPTLELSITTLSARASALPTVHKKMARAESATVSPNVPQDDAWREQATPSAPNETTVNHVRGLLRSALAQHFVYPAIARRNGWEGRVDVAVRLDREGRLNALRIVHSSGYAILDQDALLTLQKIGTIPQARTWLRGYSIDTQLPVLYRLTEG